MYINALDTIHELRTIRHNAIIDSIPNCIHEIYKITNGKKFEKKKYRSPNSVIEKTIPQTDLSQESNNDDDLTDEQRVLYFTELINKQIIKQN
jgi:hypothetical protein